MKKYSNTLILLAAGIGAYLYLSGNKTGEGTSGTLSAPEFEGLMGNGESPLIPYQPTQTIQNGQPIVQSFIQPFIDVNPAVSNLLKTGLTEYKAVGENKYIGVRNGFQIEGDLTTKKLEINPKTQQAFSSDIGGSGSEILYTEKSKQRTPTTKTFAPKVSLFSGNTSIVTAPAPAPAPAPIVSFGSITRFGGFGGSSRSGSSSSSSSSSSKKVSSPGKTLTSLQSRMGVRLR